MSHAGTRYAEVAVDDVMLIETFYEALDRCIVDNHTALIVDACNAPARRGLAPQILKA